MSLKAFHIVFIALSSALALAFGAWCLTSGVAPDDPGYVVMGVASFATGGLLVVYGGWFLRKLRRWEQNAAS